MEAGIRAAACTSEFHRRLALTQSKTVAGNADYAIFPIPPAAPYFEDNQLSHSL